MSRRVRIAVKAGVWAVCLYPVALLLYQFQTANLGANPIEHVTRTLGISTLRILLASLAMTPLRILFGISWPIAFRRLLGLFAFFSVCLHFSVWIVLDHFFDWPRMGADILKRPYITVGLLALTLLAPLAATSTAGMVKRLGGLAWRRLHRLVYVAGVLGALHFLWLAKKGRDEPFVYAGVLALLLGVRLVDWARRAAKRRWTAAPASESARAARRRVLALLVLLSVGLPGWMGSPAEGQALRRGRPVPDIAGAPWINSPPLTTSGLKGRVCQNVVPQLRAWHERYETAGLTIVGVHTPEFFWEKPYDKVVAATKRFGIRYPVVQDNDSAIWRRFGIWAWPTTVIVDKKGIVRYQHIGEGAYEETEFLIRRLLAETE